MISIDAFRPQTKELLKTVNGLYGKAVVFECVELKPYEGGNSTVLPDGTPQVFINVNHPHQEETVVHELLHLVLRKEGFPLYFRTNPLPQWVDDKYLAELLENVKEAVLHRVIFHRMQELGFRPSLPMLPLFEYTVNALHLDDFPEHGAITTYMRVLLECDDPAIQAQYRERYEKNAWMQLTERGQELADFLRLWSEFTKEQAAEKFFGCLNLLFRNLLVFVPGEWTSRDRRGEHVDQIVQYSVEPAS